MRPARPVAARLRSIFAGAALVASAGACAAPAVKSLPPVEEPPPQRIEVAEPRAQPIERNPVDDPLGDPRDSSYPIAEVLRAAGKYTEAVAYYDESIVAWQANPTPVDLAIAALIRGHRGRAAALARLGRAEQSRADLAVVKRLTTRSRE